MTFKHKLIEGSSEKVNKTIKTSKNDIIIKITYCFNPFFNAQKYIFGNKIKILIVH